MACALHSKRGQGSLSISSQTNVCVPGYVLIVLNSYSWHSEQSLCLKLALSGQMFDSKNIWFGTFGNDHVTMIQSVTVASVLQVLLQLEFFEDVLDDFSHATCGVLFGDLQKSILWHS